MKLISTLHNCQTMKDKTRIISNNCSIGQAITMIESWCYDHGEDYPSFKSICKFDNGLSINIFTKDNKYINFFKITED